MGTLYAILADFVVIAHFAYVLFILLGALAIVVGWWRNWSWVRSLWFRAAHLLAMGIVAVQAWLGIVCPLTSLENDLRERAGQLAYPGAFIGYWVHELLFVDATPGMLTLAYAAFLVVVLLGWWFAPPEWPSRKPR